jgi:hypothetical protein
MFILMATAVMLGLAGGYAWATLAAPKPHVHVPKAVNPKQLGASETEADQEWLNRSEDRNMPEAQGNAVEPAESHTAG